MSDRPGPPCLSDCRCYCHERRPSPPAPDIDGVLRELAEVFTTRGEDLDKQRKGDEAVSYFAAASLVRSRIGKQEKK